MAKRKNRLPPIEHERRQLENLKNLEPNTTPVKYVALSNKFVDIAVAALDMVRALEVGDAAALDFEHFYDLIDSLETTLNEPAE
jgi:hypothetical protein